MKNATYWIEKLGLQKHPEGGYYKEIYKSKEFIAKDALPTRFSGKRAFSTSIYFLLNKKEVSAFHRIKQDEIWHFYAGSSLTIHIIDQQGRYSIAQLGRYFEKGSSFQVVIPAGSYFAAAVHNPASYSLMGCTVAPGFDFADFEMPSQSKLLKLFPQHAALIKRFSH